MADHHGLMGIRGLQAACEHREYKTGRFGRIFPKLPPLYTNPVDLIALGAVGGPMDGGAAGNKTASVPVGQVFFGQFVDHDITLDVTSSLTEVNEPEETPNIRTPTLDLDCVYGDGPDAMPFLYHSQGNDSGVKLLTGADGTAVNQPQNLADHDLPRSSDGRAIIGDPRNDENRVISQIQLGFLRFHNKAVDHVRVQYPNLSGSALFEKAREVATWHYQWIVVNEFLTAMVGKPLVNDILGNGRQVYKPEEFTDGEPYIPVEFSVAAYRFGHSMVPMRVQVQAGRPSFDLFGPTLGVGFKAISDPDEVIEWAQLLAIGGNPANELAEKLDTKLAADLLNLPFIAAPDLNSLAGRNLLRGSSFLLPSAENIARCMERDENEIDQVRAEVDNALQGHAVDLSSGTPLWYYILMEAESIGRETTPNNTDPGEGLGPVGGRIVAEVLIGLLELDHRSYLGSNRSWHPNAPKDGMGITTLGELLTV